MNWRRRLDRLDRLEARLAPHVPLDNEEREARIIGLLESADAPDAGPAVRERAARVREFLARAQQRCEQAERD
jgi:hypothetical protein